MVKVHTAPMCTEYKTFLKGDAMDQLGHEAAGEVVETAQPCCVSKGDRVVVAAHRLCVDAVRRKGRVAFVGESDNDTTVRASRDLIRKGLTLIGSWHYNRKDTPKVMQMIADTGPQLDKLISHRFPLTQVQQAWELQVSGECAKVLLKPWVD